MKKLLSVLLAFTLIFAFAGTAMAAGNTYTVDVNGVASAVDVYVHKGDTLKVVSGEGNENQDHKITATTAVTGAKIDGTTISFTDKTVPTTGTGKYVVKIGGEGGQPVTINVHVIATPTDTIVIDGKDNGTDKYQKWENQFTNDIKVKAGDVYEFTYGGNVLDLSSATLSEVKQYTVSGVQLTINSKATTEDIGEILFTVGDNDDQYHFTFKRDANDDTSLKSIRIDGVDYDLTKNKTIELPSDFTYEKWDITKDSVVTTDSNAVVSEVTAGNYNATGGVISIKVTAENGNSQTYTIKYERTKSDDATLKSLTIGTNNVVNLVKGNLTYNVLLDAKPATAADVVAVPNDSNATLAITVKNNSIVINVTAEDGKAECRYEVFYTIYNTTANTIAINDGTTTTKAALQMSNVYGVKVLEGVTAFTLNVTPTKAADVAYVTVNDSKLSNAVTVYKADADKNNGVYAFCLTKEGNYNITLTAPDNTYTEYVLVIERGTPTPVNPGTLTVDGKTNNGKIVVDDDTAYFKVVKSEGVTLVSATSSTGATASIPTSGTYAGYIKMTDMDKGDSYTLTVKYKDATGADQEMKLTVEYVDSPFSKFLFSDSTSTGSSNLYDLDGDFDVADTKYEFKDSIDEEDLESYICFYYTLNSGYSISSVKLNGVTASSKTGYYRMSTSDVKVGENTIEIKVKNGETYKVEFTVNADIPEDAQISDVKFSTSATSGTIRSAKYDVSPSFNDLDEVLDFDINFDKDYAGDTIYMTLTMVVDSAEVTAKNATKQSDSKLKDEERLFKVTLPKEGKTLKVTLDVEEGSGSNPDRAKYTFTFTCGDTASELLEKVYVASDDSTTSSKQYDVIPATPVAEGTNYVLIDGKDSTSDVYFRFDLDSDAKDIDVVVDGGDYSDDTFTAEDGEWLDYIEISRDEEITVTVTVTDDDDEEVEYTYVIMKAKKSAADDVALKNIKLTKSSKSISSANLIDMGTFAAKTEKYSATVADSVDSIYVYTEIDDAEIVFVNGEKAKVSSKKAYTEVDLEDGKNTIEVIAYAEDLSTTVKYTITVTRGGVEDMSYLAVLAGGTGSGTTLSPVFDADTHNYSAIVDSNVSSVSFSAYAGSDATITVKQVSGSVTLARNTVSTTSFTTANFSIYTGINVFVVEVANDSDAETYYVSVYKQPTALNITKSEQKVSVDGGAAETLYAYNINGNNFIKIRDLAVLLNGTDKQFGISYNSNASSASYGTITLTSGNSYTKQTGDNTALPAYKSGAVVSTQPFYLDGTKIVPMAYNIGGNNYLMIRDLAVFLDFGVSYNSTTNAIVIDTDANYNPTK